MIQGILFCVTIPYIVYFSQLFTGFCRHYKTVSLTSDPLRRRIILSPPLILIKSLKLFTSYVVLKYSFAFMYP